jgi:hypothetical protein
MKSISFAFICSGTLLLAVAYANAYTIEDEYFGAKPTHEWSARDVIGSSSYYDISKMDVTVSGSSMTVAIYSTFFDKIDSDTIKNDKTNMGDLFISTSGWNPNTAKPNYAADSMSTTSTVWDYAVALDHHGQTSSDGYTTNGTVYLYKILGGYNEIIESNLNGLNPSEWVYRDDQMVQFMPGSGNSSLVAGSWALMDISGSEYDLLTMTFDISALLAQRTSDEWGFHWTMTCANDVIEGQAPIPNPEPSTLLLTGLGIFGALFLRRSRKQ